MGIEVESRKFKDRHEGARQGSKKCADSEVSESKQARYRAALRPDRFLPEGGPVTISL